MKNVRCTLKCQLSKVDQLPCNSSLVIVLGESMMPGYFICKRELTKTFFNKLDATDTNKPQRVLTGQGPTLEMTTNGSDLSMWTKESNAERSKKG